MVVLLGYLMFFLMFIFGSILLFKLSQNTVADQRKQFILIGDIGIVLAINIDLEIGIPKALGKSKDRRSLFTHLFSFAPPVPHDKSDASIAKHRLLL